MVSTNSTCSYSGNGDLYGVGVRIGLYSQWIATLLVTLFDPVEEESYRVVNLIIQCALFLGLCVQSNQANVLDPVIVGFLLCGSLSSLTGDGVGHFNHVSGLGRLIFYVALSAYSCWFWFKGLDEMIQPGCDAIAFFGNSRIDGWVRKLGKPLSVVGLVVCLICTGYSFFVVVSRFMAILNDQYKRPKKKMPKVEISLLVLSAGLIIFSIAVIEYIIRKNNISGISNIESVGQFIPFLVGIFSSAMACWKILIEGLIRKKRCWFIFGKHLFLKSSLTPTTSGRQDLQR
jgi:hypothetical protein